MGAPKGNEFYLLRIRSGAEKIYKNEAALAKKASEYIQYTQQNPLKVSQVVSTPSTEIFEYTEPNPQGGEPIKKTKTIVHPYTIVEVPKMRIPTVTGFVLFAGISLDTFKRYEGDKDLCGVASAIRITIEQLQTEGAAANLLNASLMARILGLTDKKEVDNKGSISIRIDTVDKQLGS